MQFKNTEMSLVRCEHIQGISGPAKGSKPYSFYQVTLVDGDFNKLEVPVPRASLFEGVVPGWMLEASKDSPVEVYVDMELVPVTVSGVRNTYTCRVLEINRE